jgi:hypothetical protein
MNLRNSNDYYKLKVYRHSCRQTLVEMDAPDHEDRAVLGLIAAFLGFTIIGYVLLRRFSKSML